MHLTYVLHVPVLKKEMSKRRDRLTRQLRALQAAQAAFLLSVAVHLRSNEQEQVTSCNERMFFLHTVRHMLHAETVSQPQQAADPETLGL